MKKICVICRKKKRNRCFPENVDKMYPMDAITMQICNTCFFKLDKEDKYYVVNNSDLPDHILKELSIEAWK